LRARVEAAERVAKPEDTSIAEQRHA
jgi:hypothetical protein